MDDAKEYKIRPYARLLTMLGDQLIKNGRIALMELIKNSYDADAEWVKVSFLNFEEDYQIGPQSKIVIEDCGHGMTLNTIEESWLNPATAIKKKEKEKKEATEKGRILQGEKGIGRFAILKLGRIITIITRPRNKNTEYVISYDFQKYDDEFLTYGNKNIPIFLDDLSVSINSRKPIVIVENRMILGNTNITRVPYGTRIEISSLKGSWSESKIREIYQDISRLQPIFSSRNNGIQNDFNVFIYKDNVVQNFQEDYTEKLRRLLEERSVFRIQNGRFNEKKNIFSFELNGRPQILSLDDPSIKGDVFFQKRFGKSGQHLKKRRVACGPFEFGFYLFDFSSQALPKYALDREDKDILKKHRIYLYRDGIRVYPYGDPEDDWLRIDATRGTMSAGTFLSNDQVVGFINISQKNNPELKDKTNREGLIDHGDATEDFIALIQTFLSYIRKSPYARYRLGLKSKNSHDIFHSEQIQRNFDELRAATSGDKKVQEIIVRAEKNYKVERQYLVQRAEMTEELAGVGLSVETASHDIMAIMEKVFANLDGLIKSLMSVNEIEKNELLNELQSIRGGMSFIEAQLKDIQLLFKSSKQRRKSIRVKDVIEKVEHIYKRILAREKIGLTINVVGSPLIVKTTDAVLLQLLLNLFDNAIYWLMQIDINHKKIEISLDGNNCQMIFSDNGPGINKDDAKYIFEPFYSGKGEEGRGLGLYIARQLLERNDNSIELAERKADIKLQGANFVVNFLPKES